MLQIAEALIDSKDVNLPKLSVLDSNMRLRVNGLELLGRRHFPLKQLDLTLLSDVSPRVLHEVLSGLENSLQILKLKFHPRCSSACEQKAIPPLKNLTSLSLNGYRSSLKLLETLPAYVIRYMFLKYVQNVKCLPIICYRLKDLTLNRLHFSKAISGENINFGFVSKLNSLQIHEDFSRKCTRPTINTVIRLFPMIKKLKLENLTDDGLQAVFTGCPQLQDLDGMNGCYSDTGVVGYSAEAINLRNEKEIGHEGILSDSDHDEDDKCLPSIASLKCKSILIRSYRLESATF